MADMMKQIEDLGIVPVVVLDDAKDALPLAQALVNAGLSCAEVTFRTAAAAESIKLMTQKFPQMIVGAGTVLTVEQAQKAIDSGAKFIVAPGLNAEIVKFCQSKNMPIVPGVMTPGEIEEALGLGLNYVKFFPAKQAGGAEMIKALAAPYKTLRFMPTGGIDEKNLEDFAKLPMVFACGGSFMVKNALIKAGDFAKVEELSKVALQKVKDARSAASAKPAACSCCSAEKSAKKIDPNGKVVTFGELMLRLAPEGYMRFVQADKLGATFGGGEANVAVSLANFGVNAQFVTKLPTHEIGQAAVNSLRRFGVDTSQIVRGGDRIGIYYLEKGASQRPSKVIYDRAGSSIAKAGLADFNWEKIFEGATWFHFTGITPALSEECARICLEACKAAQKMGITVSCDLNYRKKLWSRERAGEVMSELCKYVDVCIANEEDAKDVFGICASDTNLTSGKVNYEGYKEVAAKLVEKFGFKQVAITLRTSISANDNKWAAMLYNGKESFYSKTYDVHIVDRVGGGDSFGAGLIYASLQGMSAQSSIEFAVAASCLKHSIEGDYNMVSVAEVQTLAGGDGSGRVQR